jgi:hypothetical protein
MKKILLLVLALTVSIQPVFAAPKSLLVKKIEIVASVPNAEGLVMSGKNLITYSNSVTNNSNIVVSAFDSTGISQWTRTIDSGSDEIATVATTDSLGNIWLGGSSAPASSSDSPTAIIGIDNPDGVIQEELPKIRPDMTQLAMWKISPSGELLATYIAPQETPGLVNAISANSSGVSIVGQLGNRPFLLSASTLGVFGKMIFLGSDKTQVNALVRGTDGSVNIFGSSAEKLGGKNLVGQRDGFLMKVAKSGVIASVVRSSAPKANRAWLAADPTLTLTGFVKSGKVIETAFTKFNSGFVPTWTLRFPSIGISYVSVSGGITYGTFNSNSPIKGLSGWRPTAPSLLVLSFDSKGVLTGGFGSTELTTPIALVSVREFGVFGLATATDKSVSIFRVSTR